MPGGRAARLWRWLLTPQLAEPLQHMLVDSGSPPMLTPSLFRLPAPSVCSVPAAALARCLLVPGFVTPCSQLGPRHRYTLCGSATACRCSSPSRSPSPPPAPTELQTRARGSARTTARSCGRDEGTGKMILVNPGKEAAGWRRMDTLGTRQGPDEAKKWQNVRLAGISARGFFITALD